MLNSSFWCVNIQNLVTSNGPLKPGLRGFKLGTLLCTHAAMFPDLLQSPLDLQVRTFICRSSINIPTNCINIAYVNNYRNGKSTNVYISQI